ncbi:MAG TPA: flagellar biosynthesis protein FlhA [Nevskiaceae bacterium]|nr:flagellar biosynthesis protein FlhA [Nevskiaceae bacterium]
MPPTLLDRLRRLPREGLAAPLVLMAILAMMVVPLAPLALDLLFTVNLALSMVVLLAVVYVRRPMEFSAFPTVLLLATLLRLSLNVASSRVVLMHGHEGPHAAGKVIEAFGSFVVGGNYAVGFIVFLILTIINFMVVTKGAERVSEVSARFTLDAMPGRQMAIDADLNAGLLTREEAKSRREEVREEADFHGAMDGASKFVRGDAIAGILILFVNILGGLAIGVISHDLPFAEALRTYTLLTIGDGLVAQVPALLLSTAVAMLVTRVSAASDLSHQVSGQLLREPRALGIVAALMGGVGLIPGMPNLVFLTLAAACGWAAWKLSRPKPVAAAPALGGPASAPAELSWEDVGQADLLGLEVGYRLIPMVDPGQGGALMSRIKGVRRKLTQELGFLVPPVHIRDNLSLAPTAYRILLHGVPLATGVIYPDRELALDAAGTLGSAHSQLQGGIPTRDPAFGLEAVWIEPAARDQAQMLGCTVVDASTVVATHLSHLIQNHAHELLGFDEAQQLLNGLARTAPKLVEDLIPKLIPLSAWVRVLQGLLAERVPIRALRSIAEALAEAAPRSQDPVALLGAVRIALGRQIVQEINGFEPEMAVLTLAPALERALQESLHNGGNALEPGLAERMHHSLAQAAQQQQTRGEPPVLLVPQPLRNWLARFARAAAPSLHVLAYNEMPDDRRIRLAGQVGAA